MKSSIVTLHSQHLAPDRSRTALRFVLPRADVASESHRVRAIAERVMAVNFRKAAESTAILNEKFAAGQLGFTETLEKHARAVKLMANHLGILDPVHVSLLGAAFTAEFAPEGAALCNPSAVIHADQSGLGPNQLRVAVSLRSIGEGHISSISFIEAVIDGSSWQFKPRQKPVALATITSGTWLDLQIQEQLDEEAMLIKLARTVVGQSLEDSATENPEVPTEPYRPGRWSKPSYRARFGETTALSQRLLMPATLDEVHGMEDARFVLFTKPDGEQEYRATYTAYDGKSINPKLLLSKTLSTFEMHTLEGDATLDKGLALFPRQVAGRFLGITRSNWEDLSIASSPDGLAWHTESLIHKPREIWEIVKIGNCGSPIELEEGWLLITHGVGPLRRYALSAILLDLEDPTKLIGRLTEPLIWADGLANEGYVPNAIYSCGGLVHQGTLWLPYSEGDDHVRVLSASVADVLAAMKRP